MRSLMRIRYYGRFFRSNQNKRHNWMATNFFSNQKYSLKLSPSCPDLCSLTRIAPLLSFYLFVFFLWSRSVENCSSETRKCHRVPEWASVGIELAPRQLWMWFIRKISFPDSKVILHVWRFLKTTVFGKNILEWIYMYDFLSWITVDLQWICCNALEDCCQQQSLVTSGQPGKFSKYIHTNMF